MKYFLALGSNSGNRDKNLEAALIRMKGQGIPGRFGRGDQLVHITVSVPKKLNKKQKKLIEELGEELNKAKKGFWR